MSAESQTDPLKALLSKWSPMDVVGYILAKSGRDSFTSDRYILQNAFRKLKEDPTETESELLSEFVFGTRDVFPFSRELERAMTYLELGGLLITDNPEFITFRIRKRQQKYVIKEAEDIFSENERAALDNLAAKFEQHLPPPKTEDE